MKKGICLSLLLIILFMSCKKEEKNELFDGTSEFYSAANNTVDGVIGTHVSNKSKLWLFGAFGNDGLHSSINSLIVDNGNDNFYTCLVLDNSSRPSLLYTCKKNNEKENVILAFIYQADTVIYNLYYYSWATQKDSLIQQQKININNAKSIITYGRSTNVPTSTS